RICLNDAQRRRRATPGGREAGRAATRIAMNRLLGTPCSFPDCGYPRVSHGYCGAAHFSHNVRVNKLGAAAAREAWSWQPRRGLAVLLPRPPVALYSGLVLATPGRVEVKAIGRTTRAHWKRWAEYGGPFIPLLTTGYREENWDTEQEVRRMLRES